MEETPMSYDIQLTARELTVYRAHVPTMPNRVTDADMVVDAETGEVILDGTWLVRHEYEALFGDPSDNRI
jgi:hypothetical protein